jgi:hypothetical protein
MNSKKEIHKSNWRKSKSISENPNSGGIAPFIKTKKNSSKLAKQRKSL